MINNHTHIYSSSKASFESDLHCQPNPNHQTSSSSLPPALGYPRNGLASFYPLPSLIPFSTTAAATMKEDCSGARNRLPPHPSAGYSIHSHPSVRIGGGGQTLQYKPLHGRQRSGHCSYHSPARQTPPRNLNGGRDASEPSSPEVTCLGRIKLKKKGDGGEEGRVVVGQQWHVSLPINKNKTKKHKKKKANYIKEMNNTNNNNNKKEEDEKDEESVHKIIVTSLAKEMKEEETCLSPLCGPVGAGKAFTWIKATLRKPPTQALSTSDDDDEIFKIDLGRFQSASIYDHCVFSTKSDLENHTLNTTTTYSHKTRRRPKRGILGEGEEENININDRSRDIVVVPPPNALLLMRRHMNDVATTTITTTAMPCHHSNDFLDKARERHAAKQPAEEEWSSAESPEHEPTSIFNVLKIPQGTGFGINPCKDDASEQTTIIRQCSLPKPPIEATLWKRRAFAQLSTLIIERPCKLEIKKPTTR